MKNMMYGMILSFQFLTRIPLPVNCPWNEKTIKWALRFYPIVGIVIGLILNAILLMGPYVPTWFMAFLLLTVWIFITGGLHLDGWMDVADAIGSNAPLEKKWLIMKDPHIGSFAVISLLFLLGWKYGFLFEVIRSDSHFQSLFSVTLMAAPVMARMGALLLLFYLPSAKTQGLAWEWKKHITYVDLVIAFVPIIVLFSFHLYLSILFLSFLLFLFLYALWVRHVFKGINGDLIGTAIEGGELWVLAVMWSYTLFVTG